MSVPEREAWLELTRAVSLMFSIPFPTRTATNVNAPSAAEAGAAGDPNAGTAAGATDDVQMQDQ